MSTCPTCDKECDAIKSVIKNGNIYDGCDSCLPSQLQKGSSAAYNRRYQQVQYRKDLTQPNQREYARAYPEDFRKRYGDEAYRKYA